MLMRTVLAMALVLAVSPFARADPATEHAHNGVQAVAHVRVGQELGIRQPGVAQGGEGYVLISAPDPLADIAGGRGPNAHAAGLVRYAVYASNGNRTGMEIVAAQLGQFGVTREALLGFADRAALHTGSIPRQDRTN